MQQGQITYDSQKEIRRFRHVSQKQHESLLRQMKRDASFIVDRLENLSVPTPHRPAKRESNRIIFLRGADRETALTSLLLMKEHVRRASVRNDAYTKRKISQQDMHMVLSEFNHLVSSALQETAAQHPDSTATSLDQWCYAGLPDFSLLTESMAYGTYSESDYTSTSTGSVDERVNLTRRSRYWDHKTKMGTLVFVIAKKLNKNTQEHDSIESQVTFIPNTMISPVVARLRFTHADMPNLDLKLCTQLNFFRIVQDTDVHEYLYTRGSIEDIDTAYREHRITPYDTSECGVTLSQYVGCTFQVKFCHC